MAFEFTHGVKHGFVLGFHGNEVVAFGFVEVRRAFNGEVVGFGCAAGKNDFFRVGVNQGCDVCTCFFYGFFCFPAEAVAVGGWVAENIGQVGNHFFGNAAVNGSGGGVVEVYGGFDGHGLLFRLVICLRSLPQVGLMNVCKSNDMTAVAAVFLFNDALQRNAAEVIIDGFV